MNLGRLFIIIRFFAPGLARKLEHFPRVVQILTHIQNMTLGCLWR